MYTFTGNQKRIFEFYKDREHDIFVIDGPTGSGKTLPANLGFLVLASIEPGEYLFSSFTVQQIRTLCVDLALKVFPDAQYKPNEKRLYIGKSIIHLHSGQDEASEGRIRGLNLSGALVDETTKTVKSFVDQIHARLRVGREVLIVVTNPDSPKHWFFTDYILRSETDPKVLRIRTTIDDNPSLSERYKENLRRTLAGARLRQWYYGDWVAAEGAIYDNLQTFLVPAPFSGKQLQNWIGIDYGEVNPTHAIKLVERYDEDGKLNGTRIVEQEWRHFAEKDGQMDSLEKAIQIKDNLVDDYTKAIYVDPNAAAILRDLKRIGVGVPVHKANNRLDFGIQQVRSEFQRGLLYLQNSCHNLVTEMAAYSYDPKKMREEPLKKDDHGPDALRYAISSTANERRKFVIKDSRKDA